MKKTIPILLFLLSLQTGFSQSRILEYDWDETTSPMTLPDSDKQVVDLLGKHIMQFVYEGNNLVEYYLYHNRLYLGNKTAIENNNKVYISLYENNELVEAKARVILPDGTINQFDKNNMKEGYSQENQTKYKFFAFEGLVPGSEIEFLYVKKIPPSYNGYIFPFQETDTIYNQSLELITPGNLVMTTKSYNGLPEMVIDSSLSPLNFLKLDIDTLAGFGSESATYLEKYKGKVAYKLDKNTYSSTRNIVDYGKMARIYYEMVYFDIDRNGEKAIDEIYKNAGLDKNDDVETNIRKLENYLKGNFQYQKNGPDELALPEHIVLNKAYGQLGALRIYAAISRKLGIKMQPVLTCDRTIMDFDRDFALYEYVDKALVYFPEIDQYLDPVEIGSRLGLLDYRYTANLGLHIKSISMGDYRTGVASFKEIPPSPADTNLRNMDIDVAFSEDFGSCAVHYRIENNGLYLKDLQAFYEKTSKENKEELKRMLLELYENFEAENIVLTNTSPEDIGQKPLIIEGDVASEGFLQKAGNKVLFHIGKLIGPQTEMYGEEDGEREFPIEVNYNRKFYRTISFDIPEGYRLTNPDALKKNLLYKSESGKVLLKFVSSFEQTGNKITLVLDEVYDQVQLSPEMFPEYLKVINAAADFNKVVLVFEKE